LKLCLGAALGSVDPGQGLHRENEKHGLEAHPRKPAYPSAFNRDAGITLIELAIAFVLNHPAITAAILGPRTMEQLQSQLPAGDVVLDEAVLDRIDEIVGPGTTVNPVDNSFANPALQPAARRR
jgi:aryl-alcohol dehydrogenase-like predicted oxidoreductase